MRCVVILLLFFNISLFSQNINQLKKTALRDAKIVAKAALQQDTETLLQYTHPRILEKLGYVGTRQLLDDAFGMMNAQHIKIENSNIDEVGEIKKENKEYRSIIKNTIEMNFGDRKVLVKSSLIGFYNSKRKSWAFIESNKLSNDPDIQSLFPDFKTDMVIPEDKYIEKEK